MPGRIRTLESGAKVMLHTCEVCGSPVSPFGLMIPGKLSQWFCAEHRNRIPRVEIPKAKEQDMRR